MGAPQRTAGRLRLPAAAAASSGGPALIAPRSPTMAPSLLQISAMKLFLALLVGVLLVAGTR